MEKRTVAVLTEIMSHSAVALTSQRKKSPGHSTETCAKVGADVGVAIDG